MTFHDDAGGPRRPPRPGRDRRPGSDADGPPFSGPGDDLFEGSVDADQYAHDNQYAQGGDVGELGGYAAAHQDDGDARDGDPERGYDDGYDDDDGYYDEDGDWVELRHERFPRWLAVLAVLVALIVVIVGGGAWWYHRQVDPPGPAGKAIALTVPSGASSSRIGELLAEKGVVRNATLFNFFVSRKSAGPWLAGDYQLQKNSSYDEAIAGLTKGPTKAVQEQTTKVTIPEGYTLAKILTRIHEKVPRLTVEELQKTLDSGKVPSKLKPDGVTSYEGLLFPATYDVSNETTALELLTDMAGTMEDRANGLGLTQAQTDIKARYGVDVTPYDLIKVASMIQYEAAGEADAAKIGTVTYNRLSQGIPLGYDSTSIYEATLAGKDITKINYKVTTPYNTRINKGLPPTPIASPGTYALEGALRPADGPWLYFVLTDSKEVTFTVTYGDFQKAKALCKQRNLGCG